MHPITSRRATGAGHRPVRRPRVRTPSGRPGGALMMALALAGTATLAAALAATPAVADGTLYRWSEADGSLTYSPTPPTDGTAYETVDPGAGAGAEAGLEAASEAGPVGALDPASGRQTTPPGEVSRPALAVTPSPLETLRPAPPALGAAAVTLPPSVELALPDAPPAPSDASGGNAREIVASGDKARQCSDLSKRVVSLERRLGTPLTPEQMDTTVIQMARYQQSFDRHCR